MAGLLALATCTAARAQEVPSVASYGVRFVCTPERLARLLPDMARYLQQLGIPAGQVHRTVDKSRGLVTYSLLNTTGHTSTLFLAWRPELDIQDETVQVPANDHQSQALQTVSHKEIVLALLHPGRLTELRGRACDVQALVDHVGVRHTTVMWAEMLSWVWPDGGSAQWNAHYWDHGTPQPGVALHDALNDLFFQQGQYAIGCYTATKVVFAQGALDYYRRIKKDADNAQRITRRLLQDGEPLVHIEPGRMWSFEDDFDPAELHRPGKLLRLLAPVAAGNFVPGDWIYFLNTDTHSYQKTGYEGSNAIYLGRNRFDDYYNDNVHHYSYKEKLGEVFQWRNGVFSRSRDFAKRQPVSPEDYERLSASPDQGGLLMGYRVVPYLFGFEPLPALAATPTPPRAPGPDTPGTPALPAPPAARGG